MQMNCLAVDRTLPIAENKATTYVSYADSRRRSVKAAPSRTNM
jgi:hypothetical protein